MTSSIEHQADLLHGAAGLPGWLVERDSSAVRVLLDPGVSTTVGVEVERLLRRRAKLTVEVTLVPDEVTHDWLAMTSASLASLEGTAVVAVGGGRVLDAGKLVVAAAAAPAVLARAASNERCGWVPLPPTQTRRSLLVAVPTTIGTGSEVSRFACLDTATGKRLVQGDQLRADLAVVDQATTRTLPAQQVLLAVVEVLARVVGPYTGSVDPVPTQDRVAEALLGRLVEVGELIAAWVGEHPNAEVPVDLRVDLAELSRVSHSPWLSRGRPPFAASVWFLATELATAAGSTKAEAICAVLPSLWATLPQAPHLGSADRAEVLAAVVAGCVPETRRDTAAGTVRALFERWNLPRHLNAPVSVANLSKITTRRWGAGLPMLAGVTRSQVEAVFTGAITAGVQ